MNRRLTIIALLLAALASAARAAESADRHAAIYPYLGDDVVAVGYLNVEHLDFKAIQDFALQAGWLGEAYAKDFEQQVQHAEQMRTHLVKLGLHSMYAVVRMSDVQYSEPVFVVPVDEPSDAEQDNAEKLAATLRAMPGPWKRLVRDGNVILSGMDQKQVEQAKAARSGKSPRQEVRDSLAALGDADAGLMLFGDADSRRVVREMLPPLPPPFAEINGKLIADDLAWAGVTLKLPPKLGAAVEIQTNNAQAAKAVSQSLANGLALAKNLLVQQAENSPEERGMADLAEAIGKLHAKTEQNRVTLSLGDNPEEIASLVDILAQPIREARQAAYRSQRINNFKHIALGMLNYESANGSYPSQAILSEEGRPLLSWRVAILPYLDQQALYDQFHLDEPWDSEHNLKLSQTVVPVYQDPDSSIVRKLKEPWYTTYLGVAGKGTIFDGRDGIKIKDVIDGTSNTVMIVEVTPERAVPWTKPADWEVDMAKPFAGLDRTDRDGFVAGFADGHVQYIAPANEQDQKNWPKMLTIGGREEIE